MKSPTRAVEELWKMGFFEKHRKNKDIENKVWESFKCTCSNWGAILRRLKFLRKTKDGWIQKYGAKRFKEGDIQIYTIEAGKPRTATKKFETVIKDFHGDVSISDPYLTEDCLDLLGRIKATKIRFLFYYKQKKLTDRDIKDFKKENPIIEIKNFEKPHLHDRYILCKDKMLIIGHGLSLRNKETFMILLEDSVAKDIRISLLETFNRRWKEANPI